VKWQGASASAAQSCTPKGRPDPTDRQVARPFDVVSSPSLLDLVLYRSGCDFLPIQSHLSSPSPYPIQRPGPPCSPPKNMQTYMRNKPGRGNPKDDETSQDLGLLTSELSCAGYFPFVYSSVAGRIWSWCSILHGLQPSAHKVILHCLRPKIN
jgi:hypothetical protein